MENRVLLAVDPGISACGAALFSMKRLWKAALVRSPSSVAASNPDRCEVIAWEVRDWVEQYALPEVLVVEWPQVYRAGRVKRARAGGRYSGSGPDPNDLLLLSGVCGALASLVRCGTTALLPREWKGTLPKEVACTHVYERLQPAERAIVDDLGLPKSSIHHVLDAVGIGLHAVGRGLRSR